MRSSESAIAKRCRGATTTATAVVLLVTLLTGAGLAMSAADRALFNGTEYMMHTASLMLAESAVEDAMAHLDDIEDWSNLRFPHEHFTQPHQVGRGMVWADLKNDLNDAGGAVDTNGLLLIKGYGRFLNSSRVESIEVLYWRPKFTLPPVAGVIVCGQDVFDGGNGSMTVSGFNHYLPPEGCTGSHCNGERNMIPPDVAGIAFELAGREASTALPKTLLGAPAVASGVCWLQGKDGLCSRVRSLMRNVQRLVGTETVTTWPKSSGSYGSVNDPKFIRVPRGSELRLTGNNQGAGVMFVEGTVVQRGTFTWTGWIIVGPGAVLDMGGTYNIFGSVITAGNSQAIARMEMGGNSSIHWAADAVSIGPFNMPGLMNSWREFR